MGYIMLIKKEKEASLTHLTEGNKLLTAKPVSFQLA
jgi:hypothetical protein